MANSIRSLPFLAPAATPQTTSSTTINATAIQVQWEEVPEIDRNGVITFYEVRVEPAQFQNVSYMNVSGSELVLVVDGLEEFVQYNFTVRAYTIAGPGPFSAITTSTTDQAGKGNACEWEKTLYSSENSCTSFSPSNDIHLLDFADYTSI